MPNKKAGGSSSPSLREIAVGDLLDKLKEPPISGYSNHVQVMLSINELILDFYKLSPAASSKTFSLEPVQRIIMPLSQVKGLATALVNLIADFEADHETTLPNMRTKSENDRITLWET